MLSSGGENFGVFSMHLMGRGDVDRFHVGIVGKRFNRFMSIATEAIKKGLSRSFSRRRASNKPRVPVGQ